MNLSPPPPPPLIPLKIVDQVESKLNTDDETGGGGIGKLCYEMKSISRDEALKQIEQHAHKELERIKMLNDSEALEGMLIIVNPILEPILQNGPVCGLIALVEAAQLLGIPLDPNFILKEAISLGMTKNGEMFSIEAMMELATQYLKVNSKIFDTRDDDNTFKHFVTNCLNGNPVLIPYDADRNHTPSLRKGHAAHWAVIHGLAVPMSVSKLKDLSGDIKSDSETGTYLSIIEPKQLSTMKLDDFVSRESLYVIAHQGKSIRAAIWKYTDLISSNQNLKEISPKLTVSEGEYVLGNIEIGLCSKLILLEK